jgi:hypothetical protein
MVFGHVSLAVTDRNFVRLVAVFSPTPRATCRATCMLVLCASLRISFRLASSSVASVSETPTMSSKDAISAHASGSLSPIASIDSASAATRNCGGLRVGRRTRNVAPTSSRLATTLRIRSANAVNRHPMLSEIDSRERIVAWTNLCDPGETTSRLSGRVRLLLRVFLFLAIGEDPLGPLLLLDRALGIGERLGGATGRPGLVLYPLDPGLRSCFPGPNLRRRIASRDWSHRYPDTLRSQGRHSNVTDQGGELWSATVLPTESSKAGGAVTMWGYF